MARYDQSPPAAALEALLTRERDSLLAGQLAALADFGPLKERLLARLAEGGGSAQEIERLRLCAERNQALLAAAARGVRAVRDRLGAARSAPVATRTYASDGVASEIGRVGQSGINHRA